MTNVSVTRFRDLAIGQTFDFIDDDNRHLNSFFSRCTKISVRGYQWFVRDWQAGGDALKPLTSRVGSINVGVFHVGEAQS